MTKIVGELKLSYCSTCELYIIYFCVHGNSTKCFFLSLSLILANFASLVCTIACERGACRGSKLIHFVLFMSFACKHRNEIVQAILKNWWGIEWTLMWTWPHCARPHTRTTNKHTCRTNTFQLFACCFVYQSIWSGLMLIVCSFLSLTFSFRLLFSFSVLSLRVSFIHRLYF